MRVTLGEWAKARGIIYRTAWQQAKTGRIPGLVYEGKRMYVDNMLSVVPRSNPQHPAQATPPQLDTKEQIGRLLAVGQITSADVLWLLLDRLRHITETDHNAFCRVMALVIEERKKIPSEQGAARATQEAAVIRALSGGGADSDAA